MNISFALVIIFKGSEDTDYVEILQNIMDKICFTNTFNTFQYVWQCLSMKLLYWALAKFEKQISNTMHAIRMRLQSCVYMCTCTYAMSNCPYIQITIRLTFTLFRGFSWTKPLVDKKTCTRRNGFGRTSTLSCRSTGWKKSSFLPYTVLYCTMLHCMRCLLSVREVPQL